MLGIGPIDTMLNSLGHMSTELSLFYLGKVLVILIHRLIAAVVKPWYFQAPS